MISSLRLCRGHVPVPPVEVQVWCTPLQLSFGQISSPGFHLFTCVPHRGVGYNLWITSEALFGVTLEELSIASFCYTTPMCFSTYGETPSDFFPANQPPRCFSAHMCLLLQFSSKLCSLNPPHAWHPFCWLLQLARLQWVSDVQKAQLILKEAH